MEVNRRKQSWPGRKAGAGGWKGRRRREAEILRMKNLNCTEEELELWRLCW